MRIVRGSDNKGEPVQTVRSITEDLPTSENNQRWEEEKADRCMMGRRKRVIRLENVMEKSLT